MVASLKLPSTSLEVPETNLGAFHSSGSTECANSNIPWIHCPQGVRVESKDLRQISFRLLCHVNLAGGLIGKKGMIIKSFEDETGASIDVGNPFSGCMERVITISALESPGPYSKVQSAIICIFERMEELERNGRSTFGKPGCSARVLVPKSQISCLVDLGGVIIKEMVKSTGAGIEILDETDVPACASHCEQVLQITGELVNVRNTLYVVSDKFRNHAFSSKSTKYNDGNATSSDTTESTASRQVNISSTGFCSTDNFPRIDHGLSLNQIDSVKCSFRAFHLGSPGSSELEKLANASDIGIINSKNEVQKSASGCGAVLTGVQKPADGDGDRINNSNIVITSLDENKLLSSRPMQQPGLCQTQLVSYSSLPLLPTCTCCIANYLASPFYFSSHQIIKDPVVTRMSYKVAACEGVLSLLYGNEENYLARLRQISGADITIYARRPEESSDSTIVISGTPGQAQIALATLLDLTRQKA